MEKWVFWICAVLNCVGLFFLVRHFVLIRRTMRNIDKGVEAELASEREEMGEGDDEDDEAEDGREPRTMPSSEPPKKPSSGSVRIPADELYRMRHLLNRAMASMPIGEARSAVLECWYMLGEHVASEEEIDFGRRGDGQRRQLLRTAFCLPPSEDE